MKKLLILLLLTVNFSFSQEKIITSPEDYNYLTKELPKQMQLGNGVKDGYELIKIESNNFKEFTYNYFLFSEKETKKTKAILIVVGKNGKEQVLCLPFNNPELLDEFFKESESLGASMKMYFDKSIYNILSKSMEKLSNR